MTVSPLSLREAISNLPFMSPSVVTACSVRNLACKTCQMVRLKRATEIGSSGRLSQRCHGTGLPCPAVSALNFFEEKNHTVHLLASTSRYVRTSQSIIPHWHDLGCPWLLHDITPVMPLLSRLSFSSAGTRQNATIRPTLLQIPLLTSLPFI